MDKKSVDLLAERQEQGVQWERKDSGMCETARETAASGRELRWERAATREEYSDHGDANRKGQGGANATRNGSANISGQCTRAFQGTG
jgi:hypothetical protein